MLKGFKNILVPVFPSVNVAEALQRAIELCDKEAAEIQVINVHNSFFADSNWLGRFSVLTDQLVAESITSNAKVTGINIKVAHIKASSIHEAIVEKAEKERSDLIVIGSSSNRWWHPFNYNLYSRLPAVTGSAVLKIKSVHSNFTTVVVPFIQQVSSYTLENIFQINKIYAVKVLLLYYKENRQNVEDFPTIGLLKAYNYLKSFECVVQYSVLTGKNRMKAIDKYVRQIKGNVLLMKNEIAKNRRQFSEYYLADERY